MRDIYENFDIIPKDKKVVIWGIGQKSGEIFCETLNRKIEITYFVDATGDFADTKEQLFGKTILSKEELLGRINEKNDLFILIVKEYSSSDDMKWIEKYCKGMYYLCDTSDIDLVIRNSKRLYLYGGGEAGKRTYRLLKEYGIKVNAFIDSDCKKWNKRIDDNIDVMVYGPELIEKNDIIVISTRYYFEIRSLLTEKGIPEKNIFVDIRNSAENSDVPLRYRDGVRLWFEDMEHRTLRFIEWRHFFWMAFIDFYKRKRIILYGVNEFTTHFLCLFHLLKIEVIYCIDNIDNSRMMKKLGININYRNLCEVAYEDMEDKIVYVIKGGGAEKGIEDADYTILEKLGLVFFKHIRLAFWKDFLVSARNTKIEASLGAKYDVLLGYTYMYKKSSRKYPGYIVLGNEKTAGKKIMILGGSTSDVGLWEYFIKSWPEFLFDKLEDVCVFCGGISGYDSRQELLKLLRDGRQISPDLVISYSGFNDMLIRHADGYPYARGKGKPKETEVWGIRTNGTKSEGWIESENLMQVIASAFGADFIGMFQPILLNRDKKYMTFEEKVIYKEGLLEMSWDEYEKYQDEVKEKILTIPYIYDMTGTFYRESRGIFRDPCHLREEGNKILADAVYELILKSKTL